MRSLLILPLVAGLVALGSGPAHAASRPSDQWSQLMHKSLNTSAPANAAKLQAQVAKLQTDLRAKTSTRNKARAAQTSTQAQLDAANEALGAVQEQVQEAQDAVDTAQDALDAIDSGEGYAAERRGHHRWPRWPKADPDLGDGTDDPSDYDDPSDDDDSDDGAGDDSDELEEARAQLASAQEALAPLVAEAAKLASAAAALRGRNQGATKALASAQEALASAQSALSSAQEEASARRGYDPALVAQAQKLSRTVVASIRAGSYSNEMTKVQGITVHRSTAYAFGHLLAAAKADGIILSGGGFRTRDQQIALRKSNGCPDVWTAPSSSCRTPTAIPGSSLHELGLAVDITYKGRAIPSQSSPAYVWLSKNAKRFGYVNLPSEPWHWSITGG